MGKDHTNIESDEPYEMLGGKCGADYSGKSYKDILTKDAPELDMGNAPNADSMEDKSEK